VSSWFTVCPLRFQTRFFRACSSIKLTLPFLTPRTPLRAGTMDVQRILAEVVPFIPWQELRVRASPGRAACSSMAGGRFGEGEG